MLIMMIMIIVIVIRLSRSLNYDCLLSSFGSTSSLMIAHKKQRLIITITINNMIMASGGQPLN